MDVPIAKRYQPTVFQSKRIKQAAKVLLAYLLVMKCPQKETISGQASWNIERPENFSGRSMFGH
ncbi:hypothetical protein SAMN05428975_0464 [Mucilaginibacter sp. OK268]|uniref:hypothetical protein n=1 Tax=unclassified Mucilaginibacter TaxID=2617802 RepID=UPI0008916823|nr:hypothetical protein [Mucilaginibacter sp. OK268]SDP14474.1 hypothetical protein SAMN05428975_0464 [Mucilaginibacter sp. OK268]